LEDETLEWPLSDPALGNDPMTLDMETVENTSSQNLFDPDQLNNVFGFDLTPFNSGSASSWGQPTGSLEELPRLMPSTVSHALSSPPALIGLLGEVQPVQGSNRTWQWVIDELKRYPQDFAQQAQNVFIHPELYRDSMPKFIQAAFGISSSSCLLTENNQRMLFRIVDTEVLGLLSPTDEPTLLEELAKNQSLLLYQMIRLFCGGIQQRMVAEQQQGVLMTWALKLVRRCKAELGGNELMSWNTWILAESIRRTAILIYMLYGVNSIFREGICVGFPTLAKLPMSMSHTSWDSEEEYRRCSSQINVVSYEAFTNLWLTSTSRDLGPFEKLLVGACRGVDAVSPNPRPYIAAT
jgi:hypothetical protein